VNRAVRDRLAIARPPRRRAQFIRAALRRADSYLAVVDPDHRPGAGLARAEERTS
jgi:hypothetical protein